MNKTKISWTEYTWNPVIGCSPISEGCNNCYANRMALRLQKMGNEIYKDGFKPVVVIQRLLEPMKIKKPRMIFVCSMGDLFHDDFNDNSINQVIGVMKQCPQHIFQLLTKRSQRLALLDIDWPDNVWVGVTIESEKYLDRVEDLLKINAKVKFVSFEPLLGFILTFPKVDWVIAGGETGQGARAIDERWVGVIRDNCLSNDIPFFFKQWGGMIKGRILDGRPWDEMPRVFNEWRI